MTDQYRATPEQWDLTASEAADCSATHACILELRDRIAALEATQHVHVDTSRLSDAEHEQMAQELASPAEWRPLDVETTYADAKSAAEQILRSPVVVTGTFEHGGETYRYKANATPEPDPATPEPRPASPEAQPALGLVERVATVITLAKTSRAAAEDVLSEVAAAGYDANPFNNVSEPDEHQRWLAAFTWLEQQASQ
jgi:hypothetical protein